MIIIATLALPVRSHFGVRMDSLLSNLPSPIICNLKFVPYRLASNGKVTNGMVSENTVSARTYNSRDPALLSRIRALLENDRELIRHKVMWGEESKC